MKTDDWRILLLGGNSGAGKTYVAGELVRRLGVSSLMVDDVRIALQQLTTPAQQPDLHVFLNYRPEQWRRPAQLVEDWLRVARVLLAPLRDIMAHHLVVEGSGKLIIEGDGILPALGAPEPLAEILGLEGVAIRQKVRTVFLVEGSEEKIMANLRKRDRGISSASKEDQAAFARASWQFGRWLAREARKNRMPVVPARPHESAVERVLEFLA